MNEIKKYIVKPLVLIGALNWGSIGAFNFDFVASILGHNMGLIRVIDILVGLAAVICIIMMFANKNK